MKKLALLILFLETCPFIFSQSTDSKFDPALKPFYHGVASGDPLSDRVIIWTRVEPEDKSKEIEVSWKVATDTAMKKVVKSGKLKTNAERDFTVKVDVTGLKPAGTYYYSFSALGANSLVGKTKTTPKEKAEHLRFAVVSCSNYQAGYFNAYARIAERNDLDAVIHLGDYIYEYGEGGYGDSTLVKWGKRTLLPPNEIVKIEDYRARYATYRLDPDLRRVHQQHPFIVVWDDHETANDAYKDGAQNHNEGEGDWEKRKAIAKQVYAEWLPIRGDARQIYRKISYGNLADLIMLDTRLEGRDKQIRDVTASELYAENRTILGNIQREWLFNTLKNSKAQWKIIGNQVMFGELNVGWAAAAIPNQSPEKLESVFLDIWDGYPAERAKIINYLKANQINNTVFITGDVHASFAFDIALRPSVFSKKGELPDYETESGKGSVAIEFVSPSITSSNFDENIGLQKAKILEYQINKTLPASPPNNVNPNPHLKFTDLTRHGYFILDITKEKAQADWFFVDTILQVSANESFAEGWYSQDKENRLQKAPEASKNKSVRDLPAPLNPRK